MKISVSVREEQVRLLDRLVDQGRCASRSSAVQEAIELLAEVSLRAEYAAEFDDPSMAAEYDAWDVVASDGLAAE